MYGDEAHGLGAQTDTLPIGQDVSPEKLPVFEFCKSSRNNFFRHTNIFIIEYMAAFAGKY